MVGRTIRRAGLLLATLLALLLLLAVGYVLWLGSATKAGVASTDGARSGIPVDGPVTIARDARDIAHIRAGSVHDAMVAEGYAMASDRLFQMDLTRRFVDGRLAELLGPPVVTVDQRMRRFAIRALAERVYAGAAPDERAILAAFADGVNAAVAHEPLPVEYRAIAAKFEPWRAEDALAVGFATVLDLDDKPGDVVIRDQVRAALGPAGTDGFYPLTDPRYDVPTSGRPPGPIPNLPDLGGAAAPVASVPADDRAPVGSNGWIVGAGRTTVGKAILVNDPHLSLAIPTIWWLVEINAPGLHVAGATLAGTPGVTLGHNEHVAWGVTAGETAAMRVFREPIRGIDEVFERGAWVRARDRHERIGVRFRGPIDEDVLETDHGIVIARIPDPGARKPSAGSVATSSDVAYVTDWRMRRNPVSPLAPFLRLMQAKTVNDGVAAMRALPEPALNVLFADDSGNVAYHFAGAVPLDPSFGRWAIDGNTPESAYLAYDDAPHVVPSRDALVVTSNNRADGLGSPRLAPFWAPPYRAFEVRRALKAATGTDGRLSPDAIASVLHDDNSPAEHEFADLLLDAASRAHAETDPTLAPLLSALHTFDGTLVPESRGATAIVSLRLDMVGALASAHLPGPLAAVFPPTSPGFELVLRMLRERPRGWVPHDDFDGFVIASMHRVQTKFGGEIPTFGTFAEQPLTHPLAAFGFRNWNGPTFPGRGGSFAPAVQWNAHGQSFRAMWIAGDWDTGTIDIDAGESGEPGSPHYTDQAAAWARFDRTPLPFSDAAVRAATRSTLTLER